MIRHPNRPVYSNASITRIAILLSFLPKLQSLPLTIINSILLDKRDHDHLKSAHEAHLTTSQFYTYLLISICLVLAGGVFAGLTLGLMGQDEVYLKVIASSGEPSERKDSEKVLKLIARGKHWVLVTLLLSNVITNETLPIVLDRCLGGGWPAVVSSTVAIVIFGEVIPQSVCVRYGLQIGAFFTPFVLVLMYIMYPVAYPIACLLDKILGEDHGTIYKKSGLKTLVTLHHTMGVERLNTDEVTIISAVLDLKEKTVSEIMTPLKNVYTMSADRILDERCVEEIFNSGFSRIPIHVPGEPTNFVGMLLVRVLISYDPEDALPVNSFPLATLPETPPDTSCLNILNYFQEGKSHMVVVSEQPGDSTGALGVLTLEDVIEELIGEEIVDESDVFIDIHKAIKRKQPGPLSKRHLTQYLHNLYTTSNRNSLEVSDMSAVANGNASSFLSDGSFINKTLKPSNLASNPLTTDKPFVTIKKQPQPKRPVRPLQYEYEDEATQGEGNSTGNGDGYSYGTKDNSDDIREDLLSQTQNGDDPRPDTPFSRSLSPTYGTTETTGKRGIAREKSQNTRKFQLPSERRSTDLVEYTPDTQTQDSDTNGLKGTAVKEAISDLNGELQRQQSHSYRTGGIIESVVNFQGVNKTIIEDDSADERDSVKGFLVDEDRSHHKNN